MTDPTRPTPAVKLSGAANEELKRSFSSWFWGSIIAATVVHYLAFATWPTMSVAYESEGGDPTPLVRPVPDLEIPEPPAPIARPATPVATEGVDPDIPVPDVLWADNPPSALPPPPDRVDSPAPESPHWVPVDVLPYIKNREQLSRALEREYPPLLRDAGIGGTSRVWFYVDETGKVVKAQLHTSSGHESFDDAALRVAHLYEFAPALNRDKPAAVWVALDITFRPR